MSEPKYVALATALETKIREGAWDGGKMPSVRGVATAHNVSVVTASRALQILRDKGLIRTIERSGCYRVPPPDAERWALCLRLTPGPWQVATTGIVRTGFEALARREAMHLDFEAFTLAPDLTVADATRAALAARDHGIDGVFLLPSRLSATDAELEERFLAGCREAGLPTVLLERNLRGRDHDLPTDLVTLDDLGGAIAITRHLLSVGCQRIGLVIASPTSTHNDRLAGFLYAMRRGREAGQVNLESVIRPPGDLPTPEAHAAVVDAVLEAKLDGVVCYSDYTALGLIVELLRRGVDVPGQIAVAGFDNLPLGDVFAPGLTTYDYPGEQLAEQAVRLMRDRLKDLTRRPVRVAVPGQLLIRGSTRRQP